MIFLPHGVVRRASEVDEDLLGRADVVVEGPNVVGVHLFVVDADDHEDGRLHFGDDGLVEAPGGDLRGSADSGAPSGSDGVGGDHFGPHGIERGGVVLRGASDLAVPVSDEFGSGLRVEGGSCGGDLRRRGGGGSAIVGGCEDDELRYLFGMLRGVAAGAGTALRPAEET